MRIFEASLNTWSDLKELVEQIGLGKTKHHRRAAKTIDLSESTVEAYLVQSLVNPDFHFWVVYSEEDKLVGFTVIRHGVMPDFKQPKQPPSRVGFIITQYSEHREAMQLMVKKLRAHGKAYTLKYYYANVSKDGALKHYIEEYGAKEISRTLFVETEKLNG